MRKRQKKEKRKIQELEKEFSTISYQDSIPINAEPYVDNEIERQSSLHSRNTNPVHPIIPSNSNNINPRNAHTKDPSFNWNHIKQMTSNVNVLDNGSIGSHNTRSTHNTHNNNNNIPKPLSQLSKDGISEQVPNFGMDINVSYAVGPPQPGSNIYNNQQQQQISPPFTQQSYSYHAGNNINNYVIPQHPQHIQPNSFQQFASPTMTGTQGNISLPPIDSQLQYAYSTNSAKTKIGYRYNNHNGSRTPQPQSTRLPTRPHNIANSTSFPFNDDIAIHNNKFRYNNSNHSNHSNRNNNNNNNLATFNTKLINDESTFLASDYEDNNEKQYMVKIHKNNDNNEKKESHKPTKSLDKEMKEKVLKLGNDISFMQEAKKASKMLNNDVSVDSADTDSDIDDADKEEIEQWKQKEAMKKIYKESKRALSPKKIKASKKPFMDNPSSSEDKAKEIKRMKKEERLLKEAIRKSQRMLDPSLGMTPTGEESDSNSSSDSDDVGNNHLVVSNRNLMRFKSSDSWTPKAVDEFEKEMKLATQLLVNGNTGGM